MKSLDELKHLIARHSTGRYTPTAIPGLTLLRADAVSTSPTRVVAPPMVCVIAQGGKRVVIGRSILEYDEARCLIVSVDLPVMTSITSATPERPYLALSLALDAQVLAALLLDLPTQRPAPRPSRGIAVTRHSPELLDAFVRLVRLLDRPADIDVLVPLIVREIYFRLLTGAHAAVLRQVALPTSRTERVTHAIGWIRQNYAKPLRVAALARLAGMSSASLYRYFRAITAMSPLQYRRQIRLQEARHLLLSQKEDATSAAFTVGYGSPSQFSREYRRLFGAPPRRDVERLRNRIGSIPGGSRVRGGLGPDASSFGLAEDGLPQIHPPRALDSGTRLRRQAV